MFLNRSFPDCVVPTAISPRSTCHGREPSRAMPCTPITMCEIMYAHHWEHTMGTDAQEGVLSDMPPAMTNY